MDKVSTVLYSVAFAGLVAHWRPPVPVPLNFRQDHFHEDETGVKHERPIPRRTRVEYLYYIDDKS